MTEVSSWRAAAGCTVTFGAWRLRASRWYLSQVRTRYAWPVIDERSNGGRRAADDTGT
jgi:hypothetical protein